MTGREAAAPRPSGERVADDDATAVLDALFAGSTIGFAVWDRDLRYRLVNPALATINGVPADAHAGRTVGEVLGELAERLEPALRGVLETGEPVVDAEVLGETRGAPGVARRWRVSYFPVRDADGGIAGVAATVVEGTGIARAREAERRATRKARAAGAVVDAMFAAAPVGLAVWSPDLRFERVNDAFAARGERPASAYPGRHIDELLDAAVAERLRARIGTVLSTRRPIVDVESAVGDGDDARHYEAAYFPILEDDGTPSAVAAFVRDVTDRRRAERERTQLLDDAVSARAQAEAARARAEAAQRIAEQARRQTEFLSRVGTRLAASMEVGTTLQEVARAAVPVIADWCMVTLVQEDGSLGTLAVAHSDPAKTEWAWRFAELFPPSLESRLGPGHVIRTGELELIPHITREAADRVARSDQHRSLLLQLGLRSSLVVPLRTPQRIIGALSLAYAESGRHYDDDDVILATSLAARASMHLHNSRLYTELSHIAGTLQRSLRPGVLPDVSGVDVATRYLPVGELNEVGGDFFDLFASDAGTWTAFIGDVSGKGAEAAAITAMARYTLRAAAMRSSDPEANLRLLNETMLADAATSRFCTVCYARLRPDGPDGRVVVTLANGGHMPPVLCRADGSVELVEMPGSLIGALVAASFTTRELWLDPGDTLVLYTDGVTDLRLPGAASGERRLAETVAASAHAGAEALLDAVTAMAIEAQDGRPRDDIALMAIRARPATS